MSLHASAPMAEEIGPDDGEDFGGAGMTRWNITRANKAVLEEVYSFEKFPSNEMRRCKAGPGVREPPPRRRGSC